MMCKSDELSIGARVHLGLIDLNGKSGWLYGGAGFSITEPCFKINIELISHSEWILTGFEREHSKLLAAILEMLTKLYDLPVHKIDLVNGGIPIHSGLGSTTGLLMGVTSYFLKLYGIEYTDLELAKITGRGGTSGIGVNLIKKKGFLVDEGHKITLTKKYVPSRYNVPAISKALVRIDMPEWKVLVVLPKVENKIFGEKEKNIFEQECPIPQEEVENVRSIIYNDMISAIYKKCFYAFSEAVNNLQHVGFKKREWKWQSKHVFAAREFINKAGFKCVALSSMGPSLIIVSDNDLNDMAEKMKPKDKTKHPNAKLDEEKFKKLLKKRLTIKEMAAILNVCEQTIFRHKKKLKSAQKRAVSSSI